MDRSNGKTIHLELQNLFMKLGTSMQVETSQMKQIQYIQRRLLVVHTTVVSSEQRSCSYIKKTSFFQIASQFVSLPSLKINSHYNIKCLVVLPNS